jgi:two-component system sensor histidine kinase ResE
LKSIEDTNNAITIITIITAVIFLTSLKGFVILDDKKKAKTVVIVKKITAVIIVIIVIALFVSLRDQATRVSEGDYSYKPSVTTKDEIGQLSQAFNHKSNPLQIHV